MLGRLGRFAAAFVLSYSIVSAFIVTLCVACGVPTSYIKPLTVIDINPKELAQQAAKSIESEGLLLDIYGLSIIAGFFTLFCNMLFGLPIAFYYIGAMTGNPVLAAFLPAMGTVLQAAGLWYMVCWLIGKPSE